MAAVSWTFGIFFLIVSLIFLASKAFVFFLLNLIIAVILIPPSEKFIKEKLNFELKAWAKAIIIVLFVACQLTMGGLWVYNTVNPIVNKFKNNMENAYVDPSEVIQNVSEDQVNALLAYESEMDDIVGACYYAYKANKHDKQAVTKKCRKSHDKLFSLEVPSMLPTKIATMLEESKEDNLYFLGLTKMTENDFKDYSTQDGINMVTDVVIRVMNSKIRVERAKKMMGISSCNSGCPVK